MSYIIDQEGNKVYFNLDVHTTKSVTVYSDETDFINDIYILNLYKCGDSLKYNNELIAQIRFSQEPTKEQILYWFSQYELGNMDFYTIERGKILGWSE